MNVGVRTAPAADGGVVVLAAWCATCREEAMPNGQGCCSFCGHRIYDETLPTAKDAAASTNGGTMTTTVATAACKIDGCDQGAEDRAGPYAKLCATHKQEARETRISTPPAPRPTPTGGASSLSDRARSLVPLARAVERARARLDELPSVEKARAAFAEASRLAQISPTSDNLQRVFDTTKQLQGFAPKRTKAETELAQADRDLEIGLRAFVAEARKAA